MILQPACCRADCAVGLCVNVTARVPPPDYLPVALSLFNDMWEIREQE
jgi:hypothetical protein